MIDALIKRVSVTYECYEMYAHREERCNCSCFEIDQEMGAILLMEDIHPFSHRVASLYQLWLRKRLFSDKRL